MTSSRTKTSSYLLLEDYAPHKIWGGILRVDCQSDVNVLLCFPQLTAPITQRKFRCQCLYFNYHGFKVGLSNPLDKES